MVAKRLWWAKIRVMVMAMRVAGDEEGKGSMAMAIVTRVASKQR